jgi:ABC-type transport system substrate-binding protein
VTTSPSSIVSTRRSRISQRPSTITDSNALSGGCDKAWFGWYCSEQMESLRREWIRATDPAKRKQIADQVQTLAYEEVPYVPWGLVGDGLRDLLKV